MDQFGHFYTEKPEYKNEPPPTLKQPKTRRPAALFVGDMKYIKTIGHGSTCIVGVVESNRREYPLDKRGALFAVKIVRKCVFRTYEGGPPVPGNHENFKNVERLSLGCLPWNPFIAGLITTDTDDFNFYTFLEYFAGGSLEDVLDSGTLLPQPARFYFAGIALGVDFLHRQGLLHCDLKPDNILLCPSGYPVLTDFGIVRKIETLEEDPLEWYVLGTSPYMCPEMHEECKADPPRCSPTIIDWWAIGCTLFQTIVGHSPFDPKHDDSDSIVRRIVNRQFVRSISSLPLGPNGKDLLYRLLHEDPFKRIGANGNGIEEIQEHPWMENIEWDRLSRREYIAPLMKTGVPVQKQRHRDPLPRQLRVPELRIRKPPVHLAHDERLHPPVELYD